MKIRELDLIACGPFKNRTLSLEGSADFHLIYGPNEAGKSSTLRAITQVLYGFGVQTEDAFRFSYRQLRLGATLENPDGDRFTFHRVKGNKNTLRNPEDDVLPDDCLDPYLHAVDQHMFKTQFGLTWETLQEGGEELLRAEGELGRVLFAAGSGLTSLTRTQDAMQAELDELFLQRGQKPKINRGWQQYQEIEQKLRQVQISSQSMREYRERLEAAKERLSELADRKLSLEREQTRLERIQNAKHLIQKHKELRQELESLSQVAELPADFADRRQQVREKHLNAEHSCSALQEDIVRLTEQIEQISVEQPLLEYAEEIEGLYQEIEKYLSSVGDLPTVEAERNTAAKEARQLLESLRPGHPWERVGELQLRESDRVLIREMGPDLKVLEDRVASATQRVRETERELNQARKQFAERSDQSDLTELSRLIKRAVPRATLEEDIDEKAQAIKLSESQADAENAQLALWSGTLEELRAVRIPLPATIQELESQFHEIRETLKELGKNRSRDVQDLEQTREELAHLNRQGDIPTEDDLAQRRRQRMQGWELILAHWRDGQATTEETARFIEQLGQPDLKSAFEETVRRADRVADTLRAETSRVNEKQRLLQQVQALESRIPDWDQQLQSAQKQLTSVQYQWDSLCKAMGIASATPAELRDWMQKHREIISTLNGLEPQKRLLENQRELLAELREAVIGQLELWGSLPRETEGLSFRELLEIAQNQLDEQTRRQSEWTQLQQSILQLENELPIREEEADAARQKLENWQTQWTKLMQPFGLAGDATPAQANALLDSWDKLREQIREESKAAGRVAAMVEFNSHFEARVAAVVSALNWKTEGQMPTQITARLHQNVMENRETMNRLRNFKAEREQHEQRLRDAERQRERCESELKDLCRIAGCQNPAEFPQVERDANRKRQLESSFASTEDDILRFAGDASFAEFLQEANAEDSDALPGKLSRIETEFIELSREHDHQLKLAVEAEHELNSHPSSSEAADLNQEKQSILAELRKDLERFVQLRLAVRALRDSAERYRQKHQGPILKRASRIFRKLSGQSFAGLRNDLDEQGQPVLVGIREFEGAEEKVKLAGMSDGTADQVFLALRIAILEDWLKHHPPMPLILDDLLINFDDTRAIAALKVLAELAEKTQVIFFTHHRHLLDLAEKHLSPRQCFTQELGGQNRRKAKPQSTPPSEAATLF